MNLLMTILAVSVSKILQYYAIVCIVCLPLNLILMIILARRTNVLNRIDDLVDRLIPPRTPQGQPAQAPAQAQGVPVVIPSSPDEEEVEERSFSCFEIMVQETYQCHLNFQNRGGSYGEMVWYNDNDFVGTIDQNGLFTGNKIGTVDIFCASKSSAFDTGSQAYRINVISRKGPWFADWLIKAVSSRSSKAEVIAKNIKRHIIGENPQKRIISFSAPLGGENVTLTVQFDENNRLLRGCYVIPIDGKETAGLYDYLEERCERVKLKESGNYSIWIHQIIDSEHGEVDYYAITKEYDKRLILAFGQSWREYGEKEEFIDNIKMTVRMFNEILKYLFPNDPSLYEVKIVPQKEKEAAKTANKGAKATVNNTIASDEQVEDNITEAAEEEEDEPDDEPAEEKTTDVEDLAADRNRIEDFDDYNENTD